MMMMMMMMMIMTQMKLVNSATKFRHGMDKFYQPNSGLRSSRSLDEAIYTIIYRLRNVLADIKWTGEKKQHIMDGPGRIRARNHLLPRLLQNAPGAWGGFK